MKTASSEGEDDNAVVAFRSALLPAAADAVDADHLFVLPRLSVVQFAGRARIMPHSDRAHCKNGGDDEDNCRWLVAYPFAKLFFSTAFYQETSTKCALESLSCTSWLDEISVCPSLLTIFLGNFYSLINNNFGCMHGVFSY